MASTSSSAAGATSTAAAPPQGGILQNANPLVYQMSNPVVLFILQAIIILIFCRLLHYPLSLLRQPRVIAEVLGGILLGPSAFGRIPRFTNNIFPTAGMPSINLVANLGLIFFLYVVGLEVDVRWLTSNWRVALGVGIGGMAVPFGLGYAIAVGIYREFPTGIQISFPVFGLFVGVAMAITAFPVLCRILTEMKLLNTRVGVVVLSAGVGNDVTAWILLALCVTLVNAGSGLTALWILFVAFGYVLLLTLVVRPGLVWLFYRTRSIQNGPSQTIVAFNLLLVMASAFFTSIIGIHPIFGAFLVGVITPHEGGFARRLAEKIEDLVSSLFLPLYFALSGLSTNLGLLDSGIVWAYTIAIIVVAFFSKAGSATLAARVSGMVWRESFTVGALMSCKGLVELIVLNIGLNAKILSVQTFTMFVVMALVTTCATAPLTSFLYPTSYQVKIEAWRRGEIEWDTDESSAASLAEDKLKLTQFRKIIINLRLDSMPAIMTFMRLLSPPQPDSTQTHPNSSKTNLADPDIEPPKPVLPISAHGVRLITLSERPSSVMQVSEVDEFSSQDPLIHTFRSCGEIFKIKASGELDVVPENTFAETIVAKAKDYNADLMLIPWGQSSVSENEGRGLVGLHDGEYASFVLESIQKAKSQNVALLIPLEQSPTAGGKEPLRPQIFRSKSVASLSSIAGVRDFPRPKRILSAPVRHVFCATFGGPDDLIAMSLTIQMVEKGCTATIVRFAMPAEDSNADEHADEHADDKLTKKPTKASTHDMTASSSSAPPPVIRPDVADREKRLYIAARANMAGDSQGRIVFDLVTLPSSTQTDPIAACAERAQKEIESLPKGSGGLVVLGRNWGLKGLNMALSASTSSGDRSDCERCLGPAALAVADSGLKGNLIVVQAS